MMKTSSFVSLSLPSWLLVLGVVIVSLPELCNSFVFHPTKKAKLTTATTTTRVNVATDPVQSSNKEKALFVDQRIRESVSNYYGQELKTSENLKTNACCTAGSPPKYIQECISKIHPEVIAKYYGCGLCLPQYSLKDCNILDLGCGAGRDVYIASQLVGPNGKVVGIDMTDEQLQVATSHLKYHQEQFGFGNVQFVKGYLEQLKDISELQPESFDVIISNCVINLCTDKEAVLRECYNLLKPGGELYFSDVYSNRRVSQTLRDDPVLWGECLSGALYWNDFQNMARHVGFRDPRLVEDAPIAIQNKQVQSLISSTGNDALEFYSATYRLWKIPDLEPHCEDYGQAVIYKGTILQEQNNAQAQYRSGWLLDKHHYFETGKIHPVCGNTYKMLHDTKLKEHFEFIGTWDHHYGIFEGCGSFMPFDDAAFATGGKGGGGGGCC